MSSSPPSDCSPSSSPLAANAPKFGTPVPNRIFVGGIAPNTTEAELHALFSNFGNVKATKIISDRAGVSKGYGFVTFETEEEAKRIQKEADNIMLKDRKLNIAPAIKKQPFARVYGELTPITETGPGTSNGTILYHNGVPYTYHNGMAFFPNSPDGVYQYHQPQATSYPFVYPAQAVYVPHQPYSYQATNSPAAIPTHYLYATPVAASALSPSTSVSSSSSQSPSPGAASCNNSASTNTATTSGSNGGSTSVCNVTNSHIGGPGEFFTLYNGGAVASIPQSGLAAISMVPGYGFALASPVSSDRSGALTPTSPDYNMDNDLARNSEIMARNAYPSSGNNSYEMSSHSPMYNRSGQQNMNQAYGSNQPYGAGVNSNFNSENVNGGGTGYNDNNGYNAPNHGYNGTSNGNNSSYKNSGNPGYNGGSNNKINNNNGSNRKNGGAHGAYGGSPVKSYINTRNTHPSTPKDSKNGSNSYTNARQQQREQYNNSTQASSGTPTRGSTGFFGSNNVSSNGDVVSSRTFKHLHGQQPHLVAKSVNGVTVMAYPAPLMVTTAPGSQTTMATTMMNVSAKDHQLIQGDHFLNAELGCGHPAAPMTPPNTPLATNEPVVNGKKSMDHILNIKKLSL